MTPEQIKMAEETKKRVKMVQEEEARLASGLSGSGGDSNNVDLTSGSGGTGGGKGVEKKQKRMAIQSMYKEDVFVNGHTSVYGSYWDEITQKWGFKCCKLTD